MVENTEIATIFKIKKISDELEELVPIDVVKGRYSDEHDVFIDSNGQKFRHISLVQYPNMGFGFRLDFSKVDNINYESFLPNQLEHNKSYNYIRYSSNIDQIFMTSPGGNFCPFEDIDIGGSKTNYDISLMPSPSFIEEKIKETIKGQDDAVKKIVTSLWMTKKFPDIAKRNMLVIGPTGVGKTAIFRKLKEILEMPLTIFSVPGLSQAGYVGRGTEELLKQIYFDSEDEDYFVDDAIVILDEIDKIAYGSSNSGEVSTLGVQNELLKIIEGVDRSVSLGNDDYFEIDTSKIIFIGTGAFTELYDKEVNKIGFSNEKSEKKVIDTERLVKYGMKRELLGRFPIVIELNELTKEILKDIILNSNESEFRNIIKSLSSLGVSIKNCDELVEAIALDALKKEIGARGLVSTINNIFMEIFYQVANNPGKYREVIIGKNIINDNKDFTLISKNMKKKTRNLAQK